MSRYTHRIAISNRRILSFANNEVRFEWRDYADGNRKKVMTLDAVEFLRRFLLHVLPDRSGSPGNGPKRSITTDFIDNRRMVSSATCR